ncbi:hypothetical protein DACRYDRAFT_104088 [Dacryopinax primogenitus]|uniref:Uncharacterized protein n=1 Tax=Dacryopinax primogenitus (strain DJM 731) TaxID=1858805 RepID=M5GEQ4_DACPD|nr:uncharacterized protein DACRYDRAFT_104088 [Dacryopinax primogenitus]EJU05602.1 hypothetical protein DACRYDRAFT_104088 [Dacryopinax primogenitus]
MDEQPQLPRLSPHLKDAVYSHPGNGEMAQAAQAYLDISIRQWMLQFPGVEKHPQLTNWINKITSYERLAIFFDLYEMEETSIRLPVDANPSGRKSVRVHGQVFKAYMGAIVKEYGDSALYTFMGKLLKYYMNVIGADWVNWIRSVVAAGQRT